MSEPQYCILCDDHHNGDCDSGWISRTAALQARVRELEAEVKRWEDEDVHEAMGCHIQHERVKELEAEKYEQRRDLLKQHQEDARIWQIERCRLEKENARLRKVVDAARKYADMRFDTDLAKALRELDAPRKGVTSPPEGVDGGRTHCPKCSRPLKNGENCPRTDCII